MTSPVSGGGSGDNSSFVFLSAAEYGFGQRCLGREEAIIFGIYRPIQDSAEK